MNRPDAAARDKDQGGATPPPAAAYSSRRPELEDWLNARIFHPLSTRLAGALASTPVTPNAVSIGGGALIVLAGFLYTGLPWPLSVALGFLSHALWHVLDGADGDLARLTGRSSPIGEIVDGVCDYAGHLILYFFLGFYLTGWIGAWAWPLGTFAGFSRAFQSNHAESQRRTYLWRGYAVPWLKNSYEAGTSPAARPGLFTALFEPLARFYVRLAEAGSPLSERIDALIARSAAASPAAEARARRICREESAFPLRLQTLLGPNLRTVALGLSMAAGSPFWFFLLELTGLNLLMLWSISAQRRADRRIVERLDANAMLLGA